MIGAFTTPQYRAELTDSGRWSVDVGFEFVAVVLNRRFGMDDVSPSHGQPGRKTVLDAARHFGGTPELPKFKQARGDAGKVW